MDILDFENSTYSVNLRKLTRKSRLGFGYRDIKDITIQDINISMTYNFLIHMKEELPQYMENMVGLMMKKIFYNVKKFVDKIEEK